MTPKFDPRAALFVPASAEKLIESAIRKRPDAILLDLEDGVALSAKSDARALLVQHQSAISNAGIPLAVRVNGDIRNMLADLDALDLTRVFAVIIPKCEDDRKLRNASELLKDRGHAEINLIALIESPRGLTELATIAATENVIGLMFGSEDYMAELEIPDTGDGLDLPASLIALTARSHNLIALGLPGSIGDFSDLERYKALARRAQAMGFTGAMAIHPSQLPVLQEAFSPTAAELDDARRAIAAYEDGLKRGLGAVALDGKMLDMPVIERARRILTRS